MHLVNGAGNRPVSGTADPGVVKQDKSSGGSVDTTKTCSGPQRVRMSSGERPPWPSVYTLLFSSAYSHCAACTLGSLRAWQSPTA